MKRISLLIGSAFLTISLSSCNRNESSTTPQSDVVLKDYSVNPALIKTLPGFEGLQINTLISSDDKLTDSPNFIFGAQPDGAGLIKNPTGDGYILIDNHEILFSVSRVFLDKTFKPVKGEYIVDAEGGQMRLCSATMVTPEEHGFGPVFLTAGETNAESMVHAVDPIGVANAKRKDRVLPALGKANMENAVPLPKDAFAGKTVIIIGEDNTDGQLLAYVSNTVGDLQNGKLYFLRNKNQDPIETNMKVGTTYDVEFVEVDDAKTQTGVQIAAQSVTKKAIQFARVEDIDYRKGSATASREIYFTATGVAVAAKDPVPGKTMWGRIYKLVLDAANPLAGKLTPVIDGGIDPGNSIVNPDNICVTDNFVYIQEDGDSYYLDNKHDGRIWQYSIATGQNKAMLEMNHRRGDAAFEAKYATSGEKRLSSWEYGAMYDISNTVGIPNTFLVNIHPHTWQDAKFKNADGSGLTTNTEGGQVVIVRGVAK